MKIAFVNPPATRKDRYGTLAPAGSYAPPLALCSLAAVTREVGYETIIIDSQVENLNHEDSLNRIEAFSPQVVGITSTTSTFLSAAELASMIKRSNSDTVVVAGGVHISALPRESLLNHKDIDIAVLGEGEETIIELMDVLKDGRDLREVKGIVCRNSEEITFTEDRLLIKDLDSLPLPAWDLLPNFPDAYNVQAQSVANFPSTSVCTSTGCTGKCTFCDRRIFGSKIRAHSAEYVIKMIKDLYYNYGVRDIQFEDDNFMLLRTRLLKMCEMLKEEKMDITWSCQARVDMVKLETLRKMKETGCWMILYGVESGSKKVLDLMKKGISKEKIEKAVDITHKARIMCKGFFITGFLNEDKNTLRETYDFIEKTKLDDISLHYYTPFPGSKAYEMAHKHGTVKGDISDMTYYKPVFIPNGLTEEDLIKHTKACYSMFYLKLRTIINYIRRVRGLPHLLYFVKSSSALIKYIILKRE
ncbi:MAG: B12-binding domain-containing radical SAM protein [Candidatus Scalinduaceae bacterium]